MDDVRSLVDSSLDFWLTTGRFARTFEREFAGVFGTRSATLVNSGSSANLLAVTALTSPKLGDRRVRAGDEVITVAAGFPTTVNPILQNGLVPVYIDVTLPSMAPDMDALRAAIGPKTRAIIIAHTLGNPYDARAVAEVARAHGLWFIEDCCDALGARVHGQPVGTFGDLATVSFYPAHHITMGEGGAVMTNSPTLRTIVESFRDWGRDCWCEPGTDNTCGKRFGHQLGELPRGYDHKYTYSHIGYNLKATDMQAAVGVSQLKKLNGFMAARMANFAQLYDALQPVKDLLHLPAAEAWAEPSWFGFPLIVREGAPFTRDALTRHLEDRRIGTRLVFGGNLVRQPAYRDQPQRTVGSLANSDVVMHRAFWLGTFPGLTPEMIRYMADTVVSFCTTPVS
jgi:CDP-6-deoxy-D-xylo-4-hexulose-3-dehydrase